MSRKELEEQQKERELNKWLSSGFEDEKKAPSVLHWCLFGSAMVGVITLLFF